MTFKNGDKVTLIDAYGGHTVGSLHLPDLVLYAPSTGKKWTETRVETGAYSVHTLILEDGRKFRSEGRLKKGTSVTKP